MNEQNNKGAPEKEMSDEEIIELYWKRNELAISQTDRKYGKYLFTIAYNILRDRLDCEECVNDTYLGTWNRIPPTRPTVFRAFIARIMRNIAVDRFRKNTVRSKVPTEMVTSLEELDECVSDGVSVEEEYVLREMVKLLNEYLQGQSPNHVYIFICRYYYADSVKAIAKMTEVKEDTVYRALSRMRNELKALFEKEGYRHA
ncbi:MAG: sigma-70 family RNA polymerase sigma factor [Ruminococcaceae bacterium]|nr:sigma-70 family RNA polymerase sigma factor [Oscillospiraceae bacterium]